MNTKNKKFLKIMILIILIFIMLGVLVTVGIGNYFVNYAIARSGDGGNRNINEDSKIEILGENQKIIEENKKKSEQSANDWKAKTINNKIEITSYDGISLKGTEYIKENSNKWVIILHGYRANPESVLSIGEQFSNEGYNVVIPSMRACADSEGEFVGMGWLDKEDLKYWIKYIMNKNENAEIFLHGSSMGAATVLMASGDELPSNVKAIIADSSYTSVWDIFASEAKARFNLPSFPILNMFQIVAKHRAGYDIKEASALEQVKKSKIPTLFIHGDMDDFVPVSMCETLFEFASCEKDKLIINGAGHTDGKYKDPDIYYNKIFEFLNKF